MRSLPSHPTGGQDAYGSHSPAISGDGRFVAFTTSGGGPLPEPPDAIGTSLYVHDRQTGALERVVITGESGSTGDAAVLDGDGSRLALAWGKDGHDGVWMIDRTTDIASPVWVESFGDVPAIAVPSAMTDDGLVVSFTARGNEDGPTGESGDRHVYVTDTTTGATRAVSVDQAGAALPGSWLGRISGDGSAVVLAQDGAPHHVYRKDLGTGALRRVDVGHCEGVAASSAYTIPSISDDGDIIAFSSDSPDLVAGDTNGQSDVFIWRAGRPCTVELLSKGRGGKPADDESYWPEVSGNGRVVAFVSEATNLVRDDTNGLADAFIVAVGRRDPPINPLG